MKNYISEKAYMKKMCSLLKGYRLDYPMTQKELADKSGVSLRTLNNFENGKGITLENFIKLLIALDLDRNLNVLIPDVYDRPSAHLNEGKRKQRYRAPKSKPDDNVFKWGDEK